MPPFNIRNQGRILIFVSLDSVNKNSMDKFSEEDYRKQLWPPLEEAVKMLLVQQPGVYLKISYEEMYR